jgi:ABC-type transport system substrate-binding protein
VSRAWLLIILLTAGCTAAATPSESAGADPAVGGTLRVGVFAAEDDPFGDGRYVLDPQEFVIHPLARCCMHRTLLSYEGRPIEDGGAELRPDLAEAMPEVSADGLTWTFHLRDGLRYAPPFEEREIVAQDFITALERTVRVGQLPYPSVIEGVDAFAAGSAGTISGAQAPDDRTIVFRLVQPAGDFGNRVALPFLSPIPAEALEVHDEDYAGFVVASGPNMVEGAEAVDHADPDAEPNWDLDGMVLVRNPSWSRESDPLRPAYVDRIELSGFADRGEAALNAITDGELDVFMPPMLSTARSEIVADPELRARLHDTALAGLFFIPLNLAVPPFDDVAVRRALNAAVDRDALLGTFDPERGSAFAATGHAFPDVAVRGLLRDYRPNGIDDSGSNIARAREFMAESSYDSDGDGICDGDACTVVANRFGLTSDPAIEIIEANLGELGIRLEWVEEPSMFDPAGRIGLMAVLGWSAEYPSANDFVPLMTDPGSPDAIDLSLIGATPEQLEDWGYSVTDVPSLDDKIAACEFRSGSAAFDCWAELDQLLSDQVAAWIPIATAIGSWLTSERVDRFENAGSDVFPALERTSLHPDVGP